MNTFEYTVDGEPQSTSAHELTPTQIITNAGLDPSQRYLVELRGSQQISYKDKPHELIHMHERQRFVTAFSGPVSVS